MEGYHSAMALEGIISLADVVNATAKETAHDEDPYKVLKQLSISIIAISLGAVMFFMFEKLKTAGIFLVFFGSQTGMNMYMKAVFSSSVVSGPLQWYGMPASFFVTAGQQLGSFVIFWIVYGVSLGVGIPKKPYEIKKLNGRQEWTAVLLFAVSFTLNIALNNFSLSLIPLTLNLIIRSCLPLTTFLSQWVSTKITTGEGKPCKFQEIGLMTLGVILAGVCVWAKINGAEKKAGGKSEDNSAVLFGVFICVLSLFSGSVNLALAGVLGTSVKLDSLATVVYNAIPATLLLLGPIFLYKHPVKWADVDDPKTDWWVAMEVLRLSPSAFCLAASSSLLSLVYNVLQFGIVQHLSATHVAFAGNFNKAATIPLALLVGLDQLPSGHWGVIMVLAAIGNIGAFAAYNMVTGGAGGHGGHGGHGGSGGASKEKEEAALNSDGFKSSSDDDEEEEESLSEAGCCN